VTRRARHDDLDEDDIRVRAGRGKSRPRSKDRPAYEDAIPGFVVAVDRGRFTVLLGDGLDAPDDGQVVVTAVKARELGRKGVVVGDQVRLVGDTSGKPDALARLVRIDERRTALRRSADDIDPGERVVVANSDQLAIVVAAANPDPQPRLVDRTLIAAFDAGIAPMVIVTKTDLASPQPLLDLYSALDVPVIAATRGSDLSGLQDMLTGHITTFLGSSGVGKSTLVNALVPSAERATGVVNEVTGRGRHTSTSAVAIAMPEGGWIIDTPGVRSFGLGHVDVDRVIKAFPDLAAGTDECPRSCTHDEPECGLDEWVAAGHAGPNGAARLDSLRRVLRSRSVGDSPST
jgi:ribosome biogenesis GTPase